MKKHLEEEKKLVSGEKEDILVGDELDESYVDADDDTIDLLEDDEAYEADSDDLFSDEEEDEFLLDDSDLDEDDEFDE